jgi:hypothetical protein
VRAVAQRWRQREDDLTLYDYDFDEDNMKCLVKGLRCKATLEKLSFQHSIFSDEATAVFVAYMQTRRADSSLQTLDLVWTSGRSMTMTRLSIKKVLWGPC